MTHAANGLLIHDACYDAPSETFARTIATLSALNRSDKRKRDMGTDENCIVSIDIAYRCVYIRINMMDMYI